MYHPLLSVRLFEIFSELVLVFSLYALYEGKYPLFALALPIVLFGGLLNYIAKLTHDGKMPVYCRNESILKAAMESPDHCPARTDSGMVLLIADSIGLGTLGNMSVGDVLVLIGTLMGYVYFAMFLVAH